MCHNARTSGVTATKHTVRVCRWTGRVAQLAQVGSTRRPNLASVVIPRYSPRQLPRQPSSKATQTGSRVDRGRAAALRTSTPTSPRQPGRPPGRGADGTTLRSPGTSGCGAALALATQAQLDKQSCSSGLDVDDLERRVIRQLVGLNGRGPDAAPPADSARPQRVAHALANPLTTSQPPLAPTVPPRRSAPPAQHLPLSTSRSAPPAQHLPLSTFTRWAFGAESGHTPGKVTAPDRADVVAHQSSGGERCP
jgi:hypothetical protein